MTAEELTIEQLFEPIPLAARFAKGPSNVQSLVSLQKKAIKDQVRDTLKNGNKPVEVRIESIDTAGKMIVGFTQDVDFLTDLRNKHNSVRAVNLKRLDDGLKPLEGPLEILVVSTEDRDEEDASSQLILAGWELVNVDDRTMDIQLIFTDPISVSAGDFSD